MLSHVAWRADILLKACVGESLGAACLCSAHGYADALSREGSRADPAERAGQDDDLAEMRAQMAAMQKKLDEMSK